LPTAQAATASPVAASDSLSCFISTPPTRTLVPEHSRSGGTTAHRAWQYRYVRTPGGVVSGASCTSRLAPHTVTWR
jgi:hypothetical protein